MASAAEGFTKDLEGALRSGKKNILFSGKEGGSVRVPKNVTVEGESLAKAAINGDVTLSDGAVLKNITINARVIGVTVEKGASVVLDNVTVKGAFDTGIFTKQGGGTLTVRNSRIIQNRKGFYILPGKNISIVNNEVARNKEEGLDVRWSVSGIVSGNRFVGNGEGGAEIIAGEANLRLIGNTFSQNKASGLGIQFYAEAKKTGNIVTQKNTFMNNGNYGIFCGSPSGGSLPLNFFRSSVKMLDNVFGAGNKKGNIFPPCGIANHMTPKEKDSHKEDASDTGENVASIIDPAETKRSEIEKIALELGTLKQEITSPLSWSKKMKHWLFGSEAAHFASLNEKISLLEERLSENSFTHKDTKNIELEAKLTEQIFHMSVELGELSETLEEKNKTLSSFFQKNG